MAMDQSTEFEDLTEEQLSEFDVSDPKTVNASRKKAARLKQKRANFVRRMMDDEEGRMWMYDKLVMGHLMEPTFTPNDPHATSFKEGERNFANSMLADINEYAPDRFMQMMTEGRTEK